MSAIDNAKRQLQVALKAARAEAQAANQEVVKIETALKSLGGKAGRGRATSNGRAPKKGGRQEQVLKYIQAHPETSSGDIAKGLGLNPSAVSQLVSKLNKEGAITKDGRKLSAK